MSQALNGVDDKDEKALVPKTPDAGLGKGPSKVKPMHSLYYSPQLSAKKNFRLEKMEMWVVRDISGSQLAKSSKRVLVDLRHGSCWK